MLSESQERMLMVLKPGREAEAKRIFDHWGLDAAVIGRTTDSGKLVLRWHGEVVCDLPLGPLADEAPKYERPFVLPVRTNPSPLVGEGRVGGRSTAAHVTEVDATPGAAAADSSERPPPPTPSPQGGGGIADALKTLMACPDLASKRWVWEQYDRSVMADTIADSGGDAGIVRIHGSNRALAMTCDVTPRYVEADPYEGAKQAVAEAYRNLSAVGAKPLAVTDNLNFGNPQRPEIMGQIVAAIEGMAEACRALEFPVVSGNVSLYNETSGQAILPTPAIGAVGLIEDIKRRAGIDRLRAGDVLLLIGETHGHLGQSLYQRECVGREEGAPPPVDLAAEKRVADTVRALIQDGLVSAVHDVSDGGAACALAEMALASDVGVRAAFVGELEAAAAWFGEDQARFWIAFAPSDRSDVQRRLADAAIPVSAEGVAGGAALAFAHRNGASETIELKALLQLHEGWLPSYMKGARS